MAKELIGIDIEGLDILQKQLKELPDAVKDAVGDDVAKYMLNVVQAYPPQRRVTRKQAYGVTFFSDRQRKWFFAALNQGLITVPYRRTQGFRRAWRIMGEGIKSIIVNESKYGPFLMDDSRQSRMSAMIGWKKLNDLVKERAPKIQRIADAAIKNAFKKVGL